MADQPTKSLTDIEKEAAHSYREWPIYIVMRLKRLQAIQERLRVDGHSPSAILRREELLKAVYDNNGLPEVTLAEAEQDTTEDYVAYDIDDPQPPAAATKAGASGGAKSESGAKAKAASSDDSDYLDDVDYDA